MWINMLALFGALALMGGLIITLYIFYDWLKGRIWNLRRIWQYKHRFNKKPIAKCYCIDCRYYDEQKLLIPCKVDFLNEQVPRSYPQIVIRIIQKNMHQNTCSIKIC